MSGINIIKRGETWQYRFDIAKVGGKRKQYSKGGFKTRKEALEAGAIALAKYTQEGRVSKPSEISVSDYLDYWFENYCKMNLKYNTLVGYSRIIERHLKPAFGHYYLKLLTPSMIQEFVNNLRLKGFSKSSVGGIYSTLSCALKYAIEPLKLIQSNPCDFIKLPKFNESKHSKRFILTRSDYERIFQRFPEGNPWFIPLLIGYHTGLRINEVFALTWKDIDLENHTISVNKILVKRSYSIKKEEKSGWYISTPKTLSSIRTILIDSILLEALKRERDKQLRNQDEYGKRYINIYAQDEIDEKGDTINRLVEIEAGIPIFLPALEMVCVRENGQLLTSDSFKYCARIIHYELKIAFNFHSLRHTHATLLVQEGAHIKDVQERLGHANIETTLDTYTHNTKVMKETSITLFENHLKKSVYKMCTNDDVTDVSEKLSY